MIKRPLQQTKVHIVHKTIKKSQMTTDYVKRHGLKPTMRAFSVNDTMINGAPEQGEGERFEWEFPVFNLQNTK